MILVATEKNKKDKLMGDIEKELSGSGYRITRKNITEIDLLGNTRNYEIIHAVSSDERTVITVRHGSSEDSYRIRVSTKTGGSRKSIDIGDRLESLGFRVHEEESYVSATATTNSKRVVDKIKELINTID